MTRKLGTGATEYNYTVAHGVIMNSCTTCNFFTYLFLPFISPLQDTCILASHIRVSVTNLIGTSLTSIEYCEIVSGVDGN